MFTAFTKPLIIILSLTTATGVFLHDTRIDKATSLGMNLHSQVGNYEGSVKLVTTGDMHTHHERVSLSQALTQQPRIQPRESENRKYVTQSMHGHGGRHAFDNAFLPVV